MKHSNVFFTLFVSFLLCNAAFAQSENGWTIMYYAAGSNSSEVDLLSDIGEMIQGKSSEGYEVITLIDRIEGHSNDSTTLGENFTDTRLFRLHANAYQELDGSDILGEMKVGQTHDANMGDAHVLKRFIRFCKTYYPAEHYMLILRSHGNGYGMCSDVETENRDRLYTGELRDVLTHKESVDILGLDVCSMAGLENFYEWRPGDVSFSADYILASAPLSAAWAYDNIFNRLVVNSTLTFSEEENYLGGGKEIILNPITMEPRAFAELLIEEIYDSQRWASWGLFDNSVIEDIKSGMDELAVLLVKENRELLYGIIDRTLGYYHNTSDNIEVAQLAFPYLDAYGFVQNIANNTNVGNAARKKAKEVGELIDRMVIHSYYGRGYFPDTEDFSEGKNGAYLIIPMGHKTFSESGMSYWAHSNWYHPDDQSSSNDAYGRYDWCSNGGQRGNGQVDNFYEFLDFLFDTSNDTSGGMNKYQW